MKTSSIRTLRRGLAMVLVLGSLFIPERPSGAQETEQAERERKPARMLPASRSSILFREGREARDQPEKVLDAMNLEPGDLVADIGCGPGFYSLRLAERIGPSGVVFGVDIQQGMLDQLMDRVKEAGVKNVYPVLGEEDDPNLPPGKIDWVLLVDAYHEFDEPEAMLAKIKESLAPGGRVALMEFRAEQRDERIDSIPRDHKMTNDEVMREWSAAGFELVKRHDFLPVHHLFVFRAARKTDD